MPKKRHSVINAYTDGEFLLHFRITRKLFNTLSRTFLESAQYKELRPDKRLSSDDHLAIFLWFAGHEGCSFRDLSNRFNVTISTVSRVIVRVTSFLSDLSQQVIKWPTAAEKEASSQYFQTTCGVSGVIGCIDKTDITIDPPTRSKNDNADQKGDNSIHLQGICNEKWKFINIVVRYSETSHDSLQMQNSPILQNLGNKCREYFILGNSEYASHKNIIIPCVDNGHLTSEEQKFNMNLSSGRVRIEQTFDLLKQRFRQLYHCKLKGVEKLCQFVSACCVLHNLADENDFVNEEVVCEEEDGIVSNDVDRDLEEQELLGL